MTSAQRSAIVLPATGLLIYNIETGYIEQNVNTPALPLWKLIGFNNADNGLSMSLNTVNLGGALDKPTTISGLTATNNLAVTGTGANMFSVDSNTFSVDGTNGRVGIGTTSPTAKLEVAGQVKITGGAPGIGKVLTSDASGLATWGTAPVYSNLYTADGIIPAATNRNITLGDASTRLNISPAGQEPNLATLNVVGGSAGGGTNGILVSNSYIDNTGKTGMIKVPQFDIASPPVVAFSMSNNTTQNVLSIGGVGFPNHANPTGIAFFVDGDNILTNDGSTSSLRAMTISGITGNVGIGSSVPTSKLQVVGLPLYASNADAITGGLTVGAFYRDSAGNVKVVF
jgi:hypothetical protein